MIGWVDFFCKKKLLNGFVIFNVLFIIKVLWINLVVILFGIKWIIILGCFKLFGFDVIEYVFVVLILGILICKYCFGLNMKFFFILNLICLILCVNCLILMILL